MSNTQKNYDLLKEKLRVRDGVLLEDEKELLFWATLRFQSLQSLKEAKDFPKEVKEIKDSVPHIIIHLWTNPQMFFSEMKISRKDIKVIVNYAAKDPEFYNHLKNKLASDVFQRLLFSQPSSVQRFLKVLPEHPFKKDLQEDANAGDESPLISKTAQNFSWNPILSRVLLINYANNNFLSQKQMASLIAKAPENSSLKSHFKELPRPIVRPKEIQRKPSLFRQISSWFLSLFKSRTLSVENLPLNPEKIADLKKLCEKQANVGITNNTVSQNDGIVKNDFSIDSEVMMGKKSSEKQSIGNTGDFNSTGAGNNSVFDSTDVGNISDFNSTKDIIEIAPSMSVFAKIKDCKDLDDLLFPDKDMTSTGIENTSDLNSTGAGNISDPNSTGIGNTSGFNSTGIGNTSGLNSTGVGNISDPNPTEIGNTSGFNSTGIGNTSGLNSTSAGNISAPNSTGIGNNSGFNSTGIGNASGLNSTGAGNISDPNSTGIGNTSSFNSTGIGNTSGLNSTGAGNISAPNLTGVGNTSNFNSTDVGNTTCKIMDSIQGNKTLSLENTDTNVSGNDYSFMLSINKKDEKKDEYDNDFNDLDISVIPKCEEIHNLNFTLR